MATDRHEHNAVSFRPPDGDREWLEDFNELTGVPKSQVLNRGLTWARWWIDRHGWDSPAPHEHGN